MTVGDQQWLSGVAKIWHGFSYPGCIGAILF